MIICDLCAEPKECTERRIEDRQYDICADCWESLAAKLKGKGKAVKEREIVLLPSVSPEPETPEPNPRPGEPPKIWGSTAVS